MAYNLPRILILGIFYLLSAAVHAQSVGQDTFLSPRPNNNISQSPTTIVPPTTPAQGTGVVSPSITNVVPTQRQQRFGRSNEQLIDSRTGQSIDVRSLQQLQAEMLPPMERIEFQDFVAQSTGRELPIFGSELFRNVPSTFAPVDNVPVASDYVIGPGDEVVIRAWGQIDIDYAATVDRIGTINIPKIGTVNVAGIKYQDLQAYLRTTIGRVFRNFDLSVSLGQLRSIQIFVVGQARRPGSYTVGSMSTLVNAIFAAGGPSAKGSMRRIQLKRGNTVVTELDLYDLLVNGDKSKDVHLLQGDVIYVPPVGPLVAISGSVNVPAIFELKHAGTLSDLISWAGGLASTASDQKATIERIENHKARQVEEFKLDSAGRRTNLRNGDLVSIYSVVPRIENAVTLRGNVAQPGRFPWRQGMRVKDLIPNAEALLSRHYWLRKNQTVGMDNAIADLLRRNATAGVDISVTDLLKKNELNQQQQAELTVAESMRNAKLAADVATANAEFLRRSTAAQPRPSGLGIGQGSQANAREEPPRIKLADEIKRNLSEINWDYAVIERMDRRDLSTTLVPFNLGKAILEDDGSQNLLLQPGDVVTIFSVDDIQVPVVKQTKYVRLEGEFKNPGIYSVAPGETLRQLVSRVGGLSQNAYLFGAEFTRESTRVFQQKKLEEIANRLEREVQAAAISRSKNVTTAEEAASLSQDAAAQQGLIAKLRQVKATGRIVLEYASDERIMGLNSLPDIALEDGDRLVVPSVPSTINVLGSVYNENAFIFRSEKRLGDYMRQAGGVSKYGDKNDVYLIRADGSVVSRRQASWLMSSFDAEKIMPGDTIVVPEDLNYQTWTKVIKDYSQILYQMGLGVAAIKILRQ